MYAQPVTPREEFVVTAQTGGGGLDPRWRTVGDREAPVLQRAGVVDRGTLGGPRTNTGRQQAGEPEVGHQDPTVTSPENVVVARAATGFAGSSISVL